jgi:sec-independent protein translocase protein TatA
MGAFQPVHLIILLVIVVLLFGGSKIPELMRGVGKGMGEFKKGVREGKDDDDTPKGDSFAERQKAIEARKQELAREEEELNQLKSKSRD